MSLVFQFIGHNGATLKMSPSAPGVHFSVQHGISEAFVDKNVFNLIFYSLSRIFSRPLSPRMVLWPGVGYH